MTNRRAWGFVGFGLFFLLMAVVLRLTGRPLNVGLLAFGSAGIVVGVAHLIKPAGGPGPKPPSN